MTVPSLPRSFFCIKFLRYTMNRSGGKLTSPLIIEFII